MKKNSLDEPMVSDEQYHLANAIEDATMAAPVDELSQKVLRAHIEEAMTVLNPRERAIFEIRYGLQDGLYHTLEEVSVEFKLTREHVRQIEAKALRKLRDPDRYYSQREFLSTEVSSAPQGKRADKLNSLKSEETDSKGSIPEDLSAQVDWLLVV